MKIWQHIVARRTMKRHLQQKSKGGWRLTRIKRMLSSCSFSWELAWLLEMGSLLLLYQVRVLLLHASCYSCRLFPVFYVISSLHIPNYFLLSCFLHVKTLHWQCQEKFFVITNISRESISNFWKHTPLPPTLIVNIVNWSFNGVMVVFSHSVSNLLRWSLSVLSASGGIKVDHPAMSNGIPMIQAYIDVSLGHYHTHTHTYICCFPNFFLSRSPACLEIRISPFFWTNFWMEKYRLHYDILLIESKDSIIIFKESLH